MSLAIHSELAALPRPSAVLILDSPLEGENLAVHAPAGCRIDHAATLAEARDFLHFREYSVVLCSQSQPGDVRHELLAHVSQSHPGLPCLFLPRPVDAKDLADLLERAGGAHARPRLKSHHVLTDTVRALVAAMDARDPSNGTHSQRVTRLALLLGEALGLSAAEMETLELSALLHDVGKIAVPEQILAKPGPLDDEEWSVVREHPTHSEEILRRVASLAEVARVVRHHHERVDGGGYPDGLAGDSIPTLSQLISIVDAYEAMTADRCYRPAMEESRAREIIREGLGRQFNPRLGEVFLSLPHLP
jgi:putative nucleotidyltransferase with HDIG domain